jgi:hypothetical protein
LILGQKKTKPSTSHCLIQKKVYFYHYIRITLYLIKCFEDYESNSTEFVYLEHIFPTINKVKIKEAVFAGIHIREIVKDSSLDDTLSEAEGAAFTEFTAVTTNIYENFKAKNYE